MYENLVWDPQDDDLPAGKEILDDVIPSEMIGDALDDKEINLGFYDNFGCLDTGFIHL